tara:strand:+ start:2181 stop:3896 length:1716 start_codon:yes stop_codon:yes gene_type:complete
LKTIVIISAVVVALSKLAYTASITIGGGSFANVLNGLGENISAGSQVQVGSFVGVDPSKSGAEFTSVDWESFDPFLGIGSSNPDEVIGTFSAGEGFESVFQINSELDTQLGDLLPSEFPVRLGFRIFDTTGSSLAGVAYNTVVRDVSTWVFNDPEILTNQPPTPSIATVDDALMFWEDSENPFQTTIEASDDAARIEVLEIQLAAAIAERDARPTQEAYNAVIAERDARFIDADGDGLTDVIEAELQSNAAEVTSFYLAEDYDEAVLSALVQGRNDVTENPQDFDLISSATYEALVAERDANLAGYTAALATKDGVIATLNDSITQKDVDYEAVVAERDARFIDTDADGITDVKEIELETDPNVETVFYLDNAEFEIAVASAREAGRNDVILDPLSYGLISGLTYEGVVAERDARFVDTDKDGLTDVKEAELESDKDKLTPFYLQDAYDLGTELARFEGRTDVTNNPNAFSLISDAQYNLVVAQRDARPTQDDYETVVEERDARPTLGEVKDARLGSVVLQPDNVNNSVKIRFSIEETDDLKVWIKRDEINEVTVPLELGSKFYRFALTDE